MTRKQHYVPQVYLRGFSEDKIRIWSYVVNPLEDGKCVPIESICREKYLYEVKDNDGNWLAPNWIEKCLSILERMFAENLRYLQKKVFIKENYQTRCFFNNGGKNILESIRCNPNDAKSDCAE